MSFTIPGNNQLFSCEGYSTGATIHQMTNTQRRCDTLEGLLIVGLDNIALALSPGRDLGKRAARNLIEKKGLSAEQVGGKGPWVVSYDALWEWARELRGRGNG
jgi:hypothetical protein